MLPAPTTRLPQIRTLSQHLSDVSECLNYLRLIYNPEVRGSRRQNSNKTCSRNDHTSPSWQQQLIDLRADSFERSYAIKWLTALISQVNSSISLSEQTDLEALTREAAALLATCAGTASAGKISREFVFVSHLKGEEVPISVGVTDVPLDNHDYGSVGAQTWGGACVLAEMIVDDPNQFGLLAQQNTEPHGKDHMRILELGAGTGLVSWVTARFIQKLVPFSKSSVTIVATDYYPSVLANLESNRLLNGMDDKENEEPVRVLTHALDWSHLPHVDTSIPPFDEAFNLILGADIVYEAQHAEWIKDCLIRFLRKPSVISQIPPTFHLVIPLRKTHTAESRTVEDVFSRKEDIQRGSTLVIKSRETITCDAESGIEGDEVEYIYYKIGWSDYTEIHSV